MPISFVINYMSTAILSRPVGPNPFSNFVLPGMTLKSRLLPERSKKMAPMIVRRQTIQVTFV